MRPWRNAQEDPPPYGERVLLYVQQTDDSVLRGVHVGMYCVSSLQASHYEVPSGDGNADDVAPSHWQPLPEPPEPAPLACAHCERRTCSAAPAARAPGSCAPAEAVKAWRDASDAKEALGKHVSEGLITVDQYHADFVCCQERLLDAERALRAAHAAYEKGEA